jgi:hypothetical protein
MKTRKNQIRFALISLLAIFIVMPSCKKEETSTIDPADTAATFTLTSNGTAVATTMGQSTLTHILYEQHIWTKLNLVSNAGADQLTLTIWNPDLQNPPMGGVKSKKYYPNISYGTHFMASSASGGYWSDGCDAEWIKDTKTYLTDIGSDKSSYIEITSCDNYAKKVSGNFSLFVKKAPYVADTLRLSGTFKNIHYSVMNK